MQAVLLWSCTQWAKTKEGKEILDRVKKGISESAYHYDVTAYYMAIAYYTIGDKASGREIAMKLAKNASDEISYFQTLQDDGKASVASELRRSMQIVGSLSQTAKQFGDEETAQQLEAQLQMMDAKAR